MAPRKAADDTAAKKPVAKKPAQVKDDAAAVKKPATRKSTAKKTVDVIVQSPLGGEISLTEIVAKVGKVDKVYVRVDQNKAYWVRGEETGDVDLW